MATFTLDTGDITAAIRRNLEGVSPEISQTQVGRIVEVGDGIARISGLPGAAVNEMPPVKRFFMRHAMGLAGDLPRLARGVAGGAEIAGDDQRVVPDLVGSAC